MPDQQERIDVTVTVNGRPYQRSVEPRLLLSDFLRHELGLTGTHVGCEHGVCGACTVLVDDETARSCLMLAVQADGSQITTVEGLAPSATELHPLQEAFWDAHGLQCGFCTPGILISMQALLRANPHPTDAEIRAGLSGNLCRCTGYQNIVKAVRIAAERMAPAPTPQPPPPHAGEGERMGLPSLRRGDGEHSSTGSPSPACGRGGQGVRGGSGGEVA
jgi:carbon-monoxide dehydrogenase small subunit